MDKVDATFRKAVSPVRIRYLPLEIPPAISVNTRYFQLGWIEKGFHRLTPNWPLSKCFTPDFTYK